MVAIIEEQLRSIYTRLSPEKAAEYLPLLLAVCVEFEIDTPLRLSAFLAQIGHESGEFRWFEEIWKPTAAQRRYEPPSELAARLGNIHPGDGHRYRGRGVIQLTGRHNYREAGNALQIDLVAQPDLAATPAIAFRTAGWFWANRNLNKMADEQDIYGITKKINGGLNGIGARIDYYERAKMVLMGVGA